MALFLSCPAEAMWIASPNILAGYHLPKLDITDIGMSLAGHGQISLEFSFSLPLFLVHSWGIVCMAGSAKAFYFGQVIRPDGFNAASCKEYLVRLGYHNWFTSE